MFIKQEMPMQLEPEIVAAVFAIAVAASVIGGNFMVILGLWCWFKVNLCLWTIHE